MGGEAGRMGRSTVLIGLEAVVGKEAGQARDLGSEWLSQVSHMASATMKSFDQYREENVHDGKTQQTFNNN
jgi:hypothetical protein